MTWLRIGFEGALTHAVHESLMPSLVADMISRGHPIEDFEKRYGREQAAALHGNPAPIAEWAFDLGGMCYATMPRETISVDGLLILVDCDHLPAVLRAVDDAKIRRFAGGAWYYKLKFWMHATVLTVEQRDSVVAALDARLGSAQRRAREFFDRIDRKNEAAQ